MRNRIAIICLMLGMFFNPFGFDVLFKMTLDLTGSYWITDCIFYSVAALFFMLYFYFSGKNPLKDLWQQTNSKYRKTFKRKL